MTDSSDPMENRNYPERSRKPEGVADRLLRRKSATGVALPQIRRRLARITRASGKIRENRLVLPGSAQRERIKGFSATLRQKQAKGPRVSNRVSGNQRQVPWEQMDMSLPNGAPAESSRSNALRAGLGDMGIPSGGQVIAPFSPPASSNEPSFMERRQARIGAQEPKKPAPSRKTPGPSSRLFSRVEEVKPSRDEQAGSGTGKPPVKDQDSSKSSGSREPQSAPKKPTVTPGKSSTVQREMVRGAAPLPHSPHKEARPEIHPAVEDHTPALPDAPQEETQRDLKTLAPRKPAVEARQDAPVKARRVEAPRVSQPVSKDAPELSDSSRKDRPQTAPASNPELKASPKPQPLPEQPREVTPHQSQPPQKPVVEKQPERTEEDKPQPLRLAPKPSAASVPPSRIQREPERDSKPIPARLPAAQEPAETTGMAESRQPLEQPLASRKTPARQEENFTPGAPALKIPSEERPRPAETRKPSPVQPSAPAQKSVPPDQPAASKQVPLASPAASKPAGQPPEKSFVEPQLEKPVVFRTVLARQRDKTKQTVQARVQTRVMRKTIRPVENSPAALPHRIAARGKPNLIHRQMRRAASGPSQQRTPVQETLQTPGFGGDQLRPASTVLPLPVFARPPLRLSLRPLTASKAKPELGNVPRHSPRQTAAKNKPAGMRAAGAENLPLLLSQRGLLPRYAAGNAPGQSKPDVLPVRRTESVPEKQGLGLGFVPFFSLSAARHLRGEKMLVTHPGRQVIQRQVRQASLPGDTPPTGEARQKPAAASFRERAVLQKTTLPIQHPERAASLQKADLKDKKTSRKPAKNQKQVVKPAEAEAIKRPVTPPAAELPVVRPKKVSPVEQMVQREMAVPGPVVQRAISDPQAIEAAQISEDADGKLDLGKLAKDVYPIIKRMIAVEKERSSGRLY